MLGLASKRMTGRLDYGREQQCSVACNNYARKIIMYILVKPGEKMAIYLYHMPHHLESMGYSQRGQGINRSRH